TVLIASRGCPTKNRAKKPAKVNPIMGRMKVDAIAVVYPLRYSGGIFAGSTPGARIAIWRESTAARMAEPSTEPICRVVLYTPEPAPAEGRGKRRIAVTDRGDQRNEFANPNKARMITINPTDVVGVN